MLHTLCLMSLLCICVLYLMLLFSVYVLYSIRSSSGEIKANNENKNTRTHKNSEECAKERSISMFYVYER